MPAARALLLLPLALLLPACEAAVPLTAALGIAHVGSVTTIGRTLPDAIYSLASGRDCSAVRLDRGLSYCRIEELPPAPPQYCTRTLGRIDCWRSPPLATPPHQGVADGRTRLTALQEAHRTRGWPGLFWGPPAPRPAAAAPSVQVAPVVVQGLEPIAAPAGVGR